MHCKLPAISISPLISAMHCKPLVVSIAPSYQSYTVSFSSSQSPPSYHTSIDSTIVPFDSLSSELRQCSSFILTFHIICCVGQCSFHHQLLRKTVQLRCDAELRWNGQWSSVSVSSSLIQLIHFRSCPIRAVPPEAQSPQKRRTSQ